MSTQAAAASSTAPKQEARFRGAWTPIIKDPTPVEWSPEVRNASSVLNGLTSNIRLPPHLQGPVGGKTPPSKSTGPEAAATAATTTAPSPAAVDTTPATAVAQVPTPAATEATPPAETKKPQKPAAEKVATPSSTPSKPSSTPTAAPSKTEVSVTTPSGSETPKKDIEDLSHDLEHAHIDDHKVEEHNKSIASIATSLAEYEMTHGEVEAANKRVEEIKQRYKGALSESELVSHIIKTKCIQAALVGLIIGGCATIPGLGSIAAIIMGAAADGALTTKLQVDMVLEVGCALGQYEKLKTPKYRREVLLLSAGLIKQLSDADDKNILFDPNTHDPFTTEAGHRISEKTVEELSKRSVVYFIPVVGAITASATDLSWTYVIGRRSESLFRSGEKSLPPWSESVKTLTGVDSTALTSWLIEAFELPRKRVVASMRNLSSSVMTTLKKYTSSSSTPPS